MDKVARPSINSWRHPWAKWVGGGFITFCAAVLLWQAIAPDSLDRFRAQMDAREQAELDEREAKASNRRDAFLASAREANAPCIARAGVLMEFVGEFEGGLGNRVAIYEAANETSRICSAASGTLRDISVPIAFTDVEEEGALAIKRACIDMVNSSSLFARTVSDTANRGARVSVASLMLRSLESAQVATLACQRELDRFEGISVL